MEKCELSVELREIVKGTNQRIRAEKKIPAVLYGPHMKSPVHLSVASADLSKAMSGGVNPLFTLKAEGEASLNGKMAMVRDQQFHPVSSHRLHVDFYEVRMDQEIRVNVRVVLTGKAAGTVEGGILQQVRREIEVHCLPADIPEKIEVDITALNVGDSLHVSDVKLPKGVSVDTTVDRTVAAVVPPEKEEVAPVVAEGVEPGLVGEDGAAAADGAAPAEGAKPAEGGKPAEGAKAEPAKAEKK